MANSDHGGSIDISFLNSASATDENPSLAIYESNVSIIITGSDNGHWSAYGFYNTDFGINQKKENYFDDNDDDLEIDYLASDGDDIVFDSSVSRWDPRKYWLFLVEARLRLITKEWKFLIRSIDDMILHQVSASWRRNSNENSNTTLHRLIETLHLLCLMRESISASFQAWDRFTRYGGDAEYLLNTTLKVKSNTLQAIADCFEELRYLDSEIECLRTKCESTSKLVSTSTTSRT